MGHFTGLDLGRHEGYWHLTDIHQFAQPLQRLRAVHAWHHHVEQDEVGREALYLIERLLAAGAAQHLEAANGFQSDLGHGLDLGVVLDVKDALELSHGGSPWRVTGG